MPPKAKHASEKDSSANLGFEAKLWTTADKLRNNMETEYKHVVLGLILLKCISDVRRALIEADLVDCMVALPGQRFYSTQIPVCLWFLAKNKAAAAKRGFRDRRKQTLHRCPELREMSPVAGGIRQQMKRFTM